MSEYAYDEHYRNFGLMMRGLTKLYKKFGRFQIRERKKQKEIICKVMIEETLISAYHEKKKRLFP